MTIKVGQIIDGYRILSELGRGGNGIVYKAQSLDDQKVLALKTPLKERIKKDPRLASNFLRETSAIARLEHSNIAAYYKAGTYRFEENGEQIVIPYITMEFIEGTPFAELTKISLRKIVLLMQKVVEAVSYAHGKGVIHRDLKPTNIILDKENNPKVLDFGLAKMLDEITTSCGFFEGSPSFAAPEQFKGENCDERTDIWTLGSILYFLITGRPPFVPEHIQELNQMQQVFAIQEMVLNQKPAKPSRWNAQCDSYLDEICLKALSKEAKDRYQNADDMVSALGQWGKINRDKWAEKAQGAVKWSKLLPCFFKNSKINQAYKFLEKGLTFAPASPPIKEKLLELLQLQGITNVALVEIPIPDNMNPKDWEWMYSAIQTSLEIKESFLIPIKKIVLGVASKEDIPHQMIAIYEKPQGQTLQSQIGQITPEIALDLAHKLMEVISLYQKKGFPCSLPELSEIFISPIQIIPTGWPYRKEKQVNALNMASLLYYSLTGFPLQIDAPELQKLPEKFRDPISYVLAKDSSVKTAQEFLDALERNHEAHKILNSGVLDRPFEFPAGEYCLNNPLRIEKNGHLKLSGHTVFQISPNCSIQCYGQITAKGIWDEENSKGSICFLPASPKEGWGGIHFFSDNPKSQFFEGCLFEEGRGFSSQGGTSSGGAIHIEAGKLVIKKSCFRENKADGDAGAIYACGLDIEVELEEVIFADNKSERYGGAIVLNSEGKVTLSKCRLEDNRSKEDGGAIYAKGDSPAEIAEISMKDCVLAGNRSQINGGAVMLSFHSRLKGENNHWDTNVADDSGGAVFLIGKSELSELYISNCKFSSNRAQNKGGAIFARKDTLIECKSCRFDSNSSDRDSAGAIGLDGKASKLSISASFLDTVFNENRCRIDGGAIHANINTNCFFDDCRFDGNSTEEHRGGAIFIAGEKENYSCAKFTQCNFSRNRSKMDGGAINANLYSKISLEDCRLKNNNSDDSAGAISIVGEEGENQTEASFIKVIFLGNRCKSSGGAVNALDTTILNFDDCQFENNRCDEEAGAIHIRGAECKKYSEAKLRNCSFTENKSKQGSGAVHLNFFTRSKWEECRFKSNHAEGKHAGAIQLVGKEKEMATEATFAECSFLENLARMDGGAIHIGDYSLALIDKTRFENNKAENSGGSISLVGREAKYPTKMTLRQTHFTENHCGLDGGAIASGSHTRMILSDCRFINNSAESSCGAIGISGKIDEEASKAKFQHVTFIGNHCKNDGGAIAAGGHSQMIFEECRLENNYAEGSCGAIGIVGYDKKNRSDATFTKVAFMGNHCSVDGGAMVIGRFSRTKFEKCIFEGNQVEKKTGGAVLILGKDSSFATIADFQEVIFRKNQCYIDGGAINVNIYSQASFRNCLFEDNVAMKKNGGAIVLLGKDGNCPTKAIFHQVTFQRNQCNISGGAINANDYTRSHFTDCVFEENCAKNKNGGAVLVLGEDGKYPSDARFNSVVFRKNYCLGSGGAVNVNVFTISHFEECVFEKNMCEENGGGILIRGLRRVPNKATVKACHFVGNIAGKIGADVALNAVKGVTEQSLLSDNTIEIPGPDFQAEELEEKKSTDRLPRGQDIHASKKQEEVSSEEKKGTAKLNKSDYPLGSIPEKKNTGKLKQIDKKEDQPNGF
ncbi:MAG: protein kinase [Candidatus Brocadiae bacterium]|nr:protein kinase [Candidatus Brocadiia bacterium]